MIIAEMRHRVLLFNEVIGIGGAGPYAPLWYLERI